MEKRVLQRSKRSIPESNFPKKGEGFPPTPGVDTSKVLAKRGRGQEVHAVLGIGHQDMPASHIVRGLTRIVQRGVRTAVIRELAGNHLVLSKDIPTGLYALRTRSRITAYQSVTGVPIATVFCDTAAVRGTR